MGSLYVGNLHQDCTVAVLFRKFSVAGRILNIHICKSRCGKSLGFGYVNFAERQDAERALSAMNYDLLFGQAVRLMWSLDKESLGRWTAESANLVVKNLEANIGEKTLLDIFSAYGNVVSLKILKDYNGESKGIGFVQFESDESAADAMSEVHQKLLHGQQVLVSRFTPRGGRSVRGFTNVYLKNFGRAMGDDDLRALCKEFGGVLSAKVMTDEDGESRGFGFVSFEDHVSAAKAVHGLNGKLLPGVAKRLFVGRAKKKAERQAEVAESFMRKLGSDRGF